MQTTNVIVGILGLALAAITLASLGGVLDFLNTTQEVYAPSGRRGPTCDYRAMTGMFDGMPEFPIMNSWN